MTDERLRELERRWRATGAEDDRLAYDNARVRAGVAIETGFIVRTRDSAGAYRDKARVYSESDKRSISFRKLIGAGFVVCDIEYAEGAFQLLAFRRTGGNCVSRIFTVDSSGSPRVSFEQNTSNDGAPDALLNKDGELGRTYLNQSYTIEFARGRLSIMRDQRLFGYAGADGYLGMQAGSVVRGNPQVVMVRQNEGVRVLAGGSQRVQAVFVEGSTVTCPTVEAGDKFLEGTRLAEGRYFANDELSLLRGYQGRALTLTKTLLEVPKKCLEGLLSAL